MACRSSVWPGAALVVVLAVLAAATVLVADLLGTGVLHEPAGLIHAPSLGC